MPLRLDRAAWPFILTALGLALTLALLRRPTLGTGFGLLALFFAFFFRDPERRFRGDVHDVVSPADGRVMVAGAAQPGVSPPGVWQQVSIFLSPLDVHVNRVPVSGQITRVTYQPGRFLPAYRPEAAEENERCEVWIDHHGQQVVARQVVGVLARRVVCRVRTGDQMRTGQRYGIMKFGSRMDVFLPMSAVLRVHVGDSVRGGETVIGVLH